MFPSHDTVALASDIQILSGYASSEHYHPMCIAPNKKLYIADGNQLNEVTSVAGTTGNTAGKYLLEDNLIVRDLLNDGNYLVVIADSNSSHTATATGVRGKYRSVILFYDVNSGRPTADVIYEFSDSWLTSVKQLDGALYIFGKDNLYICNAATPPKAIFSFDGDSTITEAPRTPFEVIVKGNSILWSGQNNGVIWAYGSLVSGQKKVFLPTILCWWNTKSACLDWDKSLCWWKCHKPNALCIQYWFYKDNIQCYNGADIPTISVSLRIFKGYNEEKTYFWRVS